MHFNNVLQVCEAIYQVLLEPYLHFPSSKDEWMTIAAKFEETWNFVNCLGAIDGKHIRILKPNNGSSHYYNYKGFHSFVLMAIVGPDYRYVNKTQIHRNLL